MSAKLRPGYGWAWAIADRPGKGWCLCHWAEPSKAALKEGAKPSSEAVPVYVKIVPARVR